MSPRLKRSLFVLLAGSTAVVLLDQLAKRLPASSRSFETVLLFTLFIGACLALDRLISVRQARLGVQALELREARRLVQLRIGVPEGLIHLEALRQQKRLEKRLVPLGVTVNWHDYRSASSLLQALNREEIDFCGGGGTPSIFAQAADLIFTRVARDKYISYGGEAILVHENSEVRKLADLHGKRVAVEEGSTAHYILVRALMDAGVQASELEIIFESRVDALAAFCARTVDACSVWVPYADSPERRQLPGRSIASLQDLFGNDPSIKLPTIYYAAPELVRDFPAILKLILEELNEAGTQINDENLAAIDRLRNTLPIASTSLDQIRNLSFERSVVPLDSRSLEGLQQQADTLRELRLIPKRVAIADGTYSLMMRQNWTY